MRFLNPAGLWLLLGVPVLIIIYLIKSRHEDLPVSSTYIWHLSDRFRKSRLPVQRFRKLLLFLLQLLMIVTASLMAARPVILNGERYDYVAILDASASMRTTDENGISRFERAVEQAEELADYVNRGHTVSVILAAEEASFLVQNSDSAGEIRHALNTASCSLGTCDTAEAMALAQLACSRSENPRVLFFTDREYTSVSGITAVNFHKNEWNVSVDGLSAVVREEGVVFNGSLTSHGADAAVSVGLRIDGKVVDAKQAELTAGVPMELSFPVNAPVHYDTAELFIEENDGLAEDNSYALCKRNTGTHRVLLVSASPLYLESALNALGNCEVTVLPLPIETEMSGYDLYIFDNIPMAQYPEDGSVLLFGMPGILPDGLSSGYTIAEETPLNMVKRQDSDFYADLTLEETVVSIYTELVGDDSWESVFTCGDASVFMTKAAAGGLRFSVISFDPRDSNLPMQSDFVLLMRNVVENSVPALLRDTDYTVGETVTLTVSPKMLQLYAELPDGSVKQLSASGAVSGGVCSMPVNEVGIYTAVMTTEDGGEYVDFFVHLSPEESAAQIGGGGSLSLELAGTAGEEPAEEEALTEIGVWAAVLLLLLILTEWGYYSRDSY